MSPLQDGIGRVHLKFPPVGDHHKEDVQLFLWVRCDRFELSLFKSDNQEEILIVVHLKS